MAGLQTIVKYSCLSDEHRWVADRYEWPWLADLDEHDRDIIKLLDCLSDGEFSGAASAVQMYDLLIKEREDGYPEELACDWSEIFSYINVIVYEEMRHGLSLGLANHYVTTGKLDFIKNLTPREFGRKYVWCFNERKYWDLYAYLLAHLFGEVVNTEMYRDMKNRVHHPDLKRIITNIMTDEARHTRAWASLITNLVKADPRHEKRALRSLERGLTYHNAMVHETYFEGQNKLMRVFLPKQPGLESSVERIIRKKYDLLPEIFGDKNPFTLDDVKKLHMDFLRNGIGETRARYSPTAKGNIEFLQQSA